MERTDSLVRLVLQRDRRQGEDRRVDSRGGRRAADGGLLDQQVAVQAAEAIQRAAHDARWRAARRPTYVH